jgi:uncharacterized protein
VIFVDTSFWVAAASARDNRHEEAVSLLEQSSDVPLITSTLVRGETWTFLNRRRGHHSASAFLDRLERSPRVEIVPFPVELETKALAWLRQRDERTYSYVDATSFVLMKSMRVKQALAFDGDFSAAGFVELRA